MSWFSNFLTSSIGKKLLMSLTGLFLILFLKVHLLGNLQLLKNDGGESFNVYAHFMTHNPLIMFISYGNYFFILMHFILGLSLWAKKRAAKGTTYAISNHRDSSWASRNMALLGILVLAFLLLHMGDFWWKMKTGQTGMVMVGEMEVKDLYTKVAESFKVTWIVIAYLIGLMALAFHLYHGFASAFQTLGINHTKYSPVIRFIGTAFSILVPLAYAIIPLVFYFTK
ncbi:MAG: succinate dehydrogenase cytochrome b subunit [Saprospiraceae bacterium]|nr:succinate dehydrogenase cytochrome b subunit [Saprospiraceae bacterium]